MKLERLLAAVLSGALLSGCATQNVSFTSFPSGVNVVAGDKHGVTPCTLRVREDLTHATFSLPSGETKVLPMPEMDSDMQETGEELGRATGGILMVAGGITGLAGFGIFLLGASGKDEETDRFGNDSGSSADSEEYTAMGVGLAGMAVGAGIYFLGKWIYPDNDTPALHAEFLISVKGGPTEDEDRYEDADFGARRLKKAVPEA